MIESGAAVLDVGGESTRPGSEPVEADEQIRRVVPVIRALAGRSLISIPTGNSRVAEAALDAGANIINDIYGGLLDPKLLPLAAERSSGNPRWPATMQVDPRYSDVMAEVTAFLKGRVDAAVNSGIDRHRVLVDPGIGFEDQRAQFDASWAIEGAQVAWPTATGRDQSQRVHREDHRGKHRVRPAVRLSGDGRLVHR